MDTATSQEIEKVRVLELALLDREDIIGVIRNPNRYVTKKERVKINIIKALLEQDMTIPIVSLPPSRMLVDKEYIMKFKKEE